MTITEYRQIEKQADEAINALRQATANNAVTPEAIAEAAALVAQLEQAEAALSFGDVLQIEWERRQAANVYITTKSGAIVIPMPA